MGLGVEFLGYRHLEKLGETLDLLEFGVFLEVIGLARLRLEDQSDYVVHLRYRLVYWMV